MRRVLSLIFTAFTVAAAVLVSTPVSAGGFVVDTSADEVDAAPGDGACRTAGGACTLRAAIMEANALGGSNTIVLPAGTYGITLPEAFPQDNPATGATAGDFDVTSTITILGSGVGATIISGNGQARVFDVETSGSLSLHDLTVQDGRAPELHPLTGGGIFNKGQLFVTNVLVQGNVAPMLGLSAGRGGGIANEGTATLHRVTIRGNQAFSGGGGGLFSSGVLTASDVEVSGNSAHAGGGLIMSGTATLERALVADNTAYADRLTAGSGGGIHASGQLTLVNTTVSGNRASDRDLTDPGRGGGVMWTGSAGQATIRNVTFKDNVADRRELPHANGDNIYALYGTGLQIENSAIDGDPARTSCVGPIESLGHNVEDGTTCSLSAASDQSSTDPLLAALADNGGISRSHLPQSGSPLIDNANAATCLTVDQRGFARPADGDGNGSTICDIGAVEVGGTAAPTPTVTPTLTPQPTVTNTPTVTPTPTSTVVPTSTVTPTIPVVPTACSPRPRVMVQMASVAPGRLRVTVSSTTLPATPVNALQRISFTGLQNARVDIRNLTGVDRPITVELNEHPAQVQFDVVRNSPGVATIIFSVFDGCGEWKSFVGGGQGAF